MESRHTLHGREVHWLRLLLHCLIRRHHRVTFWFGASGGVTVCRECHLARISEPTEEEK